ncbi:MAG: glycine cleavage system aminomethyltransferase GcvT [Gemmatimonadota bacterium]|nr:glycine cleavage system aminomethyltransferase GcvT [Gemmatimonadota bacterium]MDP6802327.1 glycine cleavage system aminomethyltransferase GcvT [Gemmatimonadota bacterium]MDP7031939.1 glycine cleavage system aminomethyltransferase GcvT [Gemmatimonadota bacterium]
MVVDSSRRTALCEVHEASGARLVDFAGFRMPLSYDGILAEHRRVRESAGLFDVSHMGVVEIRGAGTRAFLDRLTTNDLSRVEPLRAQYTLMLNTRGGVIDDLILYRLDDRFLAVLNAGNREKDCDWMAAHLPEDVDLRNVSDRTVLLAWQGPRAAEILSDLTEIDLPSVPAFGVARGHFAGVPGVLARTGYTGEDGFELFLPSSDAAIVWEALLKAGKSVGAGPAGLGSRDTLRLEKQYRLYGQDMDEDVTAWEAGLGGVVKMDKGDFLGRDALEAQKVSGVPFSTVGLSVVPPEDGKRLIPRPGCVVLADGEEAGRVTSGTFSPSLGRGIALARVDRAAARAKEFVIRIRDREVAAHRVRKSFL